MSFLHTAYRLLNSFPLFCVKFKALKTLTSIFVNNTEKTVINLNSGQFERVYTELLKMFHCIPRRPSNTLVLHIKVSDLSMQTG